MKVKILLLIIIVLAAAVRIYKLDSVPSSISWDEAAVGYNAWTIANYGKDEYGKFFPTSFRSFGEYKNPVDIYITSIFVKLMDLNEFSIRLPAALFGVFNVLLIYFLAKLLFKNEYIGLISAFFLAISPFNIHFSRFNHEANFALFFLLGGIILFILSIKNGKKLLPYSVLSFCLSFLSYNPPKVIVPATLLILVALYTKELAKKRGELILSLILLGFFLVLVFLNPQLLGRARINQTIQGKSDIEKTRLFQLTQNELLGRVNLAAIQYSWHFSGVFLFISGDKNPRLSSQSTGEFYKLDALFLVLGILYLFVKRTRENFLLLGLALLAPLPSSLVADAPHAGRAMFMMGSWHIIAAVGFYQLVSIFKKPILKLIITAIFVVILFFSLWNYSSYYFGEYAKRYAIEWQYGMKQIVNFVRDNPEYNQVFMTDVRSQPYIFFLYYLQTPLPEYLNTVVYNRSESKSYNNVSYFDRFYFGGWDPIESMPTPDVLYVVSPSEYDGLRHKLLFDVKQTIYYPNGTAAFYLVSAK